MDHAKVSNINRVAEDRCPGRAVSVSAGVYPPLIAGWAELCLRVSMADTRQAHGNYRTFYNFDTLPPPDTGHTLFLASLCWIRVEISTFKPCTTGHYQIFTLYQSWFVPCDTEFPPDSNDTQRNLAPGLSCLELQG